MFALLLSALSLSGCLGLSNQTTAAATVNGAVIDEADVTAYIEDFRNQDESRETDSGWAQYLSNSGYTAETLRTYVLESVFIPKTVMHQEASSMGLEITDDELDQTIQAEKEYYEGRYGADTWSSVLASYGYDEASWRQNEEDRLLEERVKDSVIGEKTPSRSQLSTYAPQFASNYNGKHSYAIFFDNQDDAQAALDELGGAGSGVKLKAFKKLGVKYAKKARKAAKAAESAPEDAAAEVDNPSDTDADASETAAAGDESVAYSQQDGAVDCGWGSLESGFGATHTTYANALNDIGEGTVGEVLDMGNSKWALILCDEAYVAEDNDVNLNAMPKPIYDQVESDVADLLQDKEFDKWLDDATDKCTVKINDMPDGLSYDVNVSLG